MNRHMWISQEGDAEAVYKPSSNIFLQQTSEAVAAHWHKSERDSVKEQQEQMETMTGKLIGLFPLVVTLPAPVKHRAHHHDLR